MTKRVELNGHEFKIIFRKIQEVYWNKVDYKEIAKNKSRFFGYDNKDPYESGNEKPTENSLKKAIVENEDIAAYLQKHFSKTRKKGDFKVLYNGKHLYSLYHFFLDDSGNIKDETKTKGLEEPYLTVYLMFSGIESYGELKKLVRDKREDEARKVETIELKGFHYSYSRHGIHQFELTISFDGENKYDVEQKGFHNKKGPPPIYRASGCSIIEKKLHAELTHKETNDKFKIIINSGDNPFDKEVMLCSILAISSRAGGEPLCIEGVLLKNDDELINDYELSIKRFLSLHRYSFRVRVGNISLNKLRASNVDVNAIDHLVGKWRVWRLDEKGKNVIQSVLYIEDDYRAYCYNDDRSYSQINNKIQVCLIQITIDNVLKSRTLCITTHPYNGTDVIGFVMLKIPSKEGRKKTRQTSGGTVSLIGRQDRYSFSRPIAIWKDDNIEIKETDPKRIWKELHGRGELQTFSLKNIEVKKGTNEKPLYEKFQEIRKKLLL